ncbi:hypothetical protein KY330_00810 [Candidatus Woesearchaeota archaeon]|nr:hypothetical protein [Candidatus Woesearchaeota archaeon]
MNKKVVIFTIMLCILPFVMGQNYSNIIDEIPLIKTPTEYNQIKDLIEGFNNNIIIEITNKNIDVNNEVDYLSNRLSKDSCNVVILMLNYELKVSPDKCNFDQSYLKSPAIINALQTEDYIGALVNLIHYVIENNPIKSKEESQQTKPLQVLRPGEINRDALFKVLIVPVDWKNKAIYLSEASYVREKIKSAFPFGGCEDKIEVIIPELLDYGDSWRDSSCYVPYQHCNTFRLLTPLAEIPNKPYSVLSQLDFIYNCAKQYQSKTGISFDRVIGLIEEDLSPHAEKCSDGMSGGGWTFMYSPVIISHKDSVIHELGHTFGFNEQYCDMEYKAVSPQYYNSRVFNPSFFVKNPLFDSQKTQLCGMYDLVNPLQPSLGCAGALDKGCFNAFDDDGDTMMLGNYDRFAKDTNGDGKLDSGARTAMSSGFNYDINEFNHLKKFLGCDKQFSQSYLRANSPGRY